MCILTTARVDTWREVSFQPQPVRCKSPLRVGYAHPLRLSRRKEKFACLYSAPGLALVCPVPAAPRQTLNDQSRDLFRLGSGQIDTASSED